LLRIYALEKNTTSEINIETNIVTVGSAPKFKKTYEIGKFNTNSVATTSSYFLILPVAKIDTVSGPLAESIIPLIKTNCVKATAYFGTSLSHNSKTNELFESIGKTKMAIRKVHKYVLRIISLFKVL
jgi:hypothetical protein